MVKKQKNNYFTHDHEKAILDYVATDNLAERTKLYVEFIEPSFSEMVEKITYTYKFTSLPNINCLKKECKIWLVMILDKFDPKKGFKAFSYFSIITKNWFIAKTKAYANQNKKEIQCDDATKEMIFNELGDEKYISRREEMEFWNSLLGEIDTWYGGCEKENEKRVLDAIKILMKNVDSIDIFNKKAMYFFLREITGLSTKQIVNCLGRFREDYRTFKKKWDSGQL